MYNFTDDCLIGIEMIDNEHRELFRIVNDIQNLLDSDANDKYDRSIEMIDRLKEYAKEHFRHEELYMESIDHPELELQKKQHSDFCDKINEADMTIAGSGQDEFLTDLLKFLVTWLYRHIIGSDLLIGKLRPVNERSQKIEFTDKYLTGISQIDEEHKELFRIIDNLYSVMNDDFIADKYDEIISLLEQLKNYTKFHFEDEEAYMKKINYKDLPAQQRAHEAFIARLDDMDLAHIDENQQDTLEELLEFLTEWLTNHILHSDKNIGK